MKYRVLMAGLFLFAYAAPVQAEDCVLHVVRTACADQEDISYKKCHGKKECDEPDAAAKDAAACTEAAKKSCANKRLEITKFKAITAKFQGKDLVGGFNATGAPDAAGLYFCDANAPDLNKCQ